MPRHVEEHGWIGTRQGCPTGGLQLASLVSSGHRLAAALLPSSISRSRSTSYRRCTRKPGRCRVCLRRRWRGRWRGRWRDTSAAGDNTVHTAGHLRVLCVREREGRGRRAPLWGSPAVRRATAHRGWRRPAAQEPGGGGVPHELGLGGFLGAVGEQQLHRGRQAGRQQEKQEQEGDGSGVVVCPGGGM